eukprot:7377472-Prymnesium_polylepis.1
MDEYGWALVSAGPSTTPSVCARASTGGAGPCAVSRGRESESGFARPRGRERFRAAERASAAERARARREGARCGLTFPTRNSIGCANMQATAVGAFHM